MLLRYDRIRKCNNTMVLSRWGEFPCERRNYRLRRRESRILEILRIRTIPPLTQKRDELAKFAEIQRALLESDRRGKFNSPSLSSFR